MILDEMQDMTQDEVHEMVLDEMHDMKHRRGPYCSHEALVSGCQLLIGCNRHIVNAHKLDASCHHPVSTILCQGSVV